MHQLYMAKLGVQLQEEKAKQQQQQGRTSRTQRVKQKQALERQERERIRFESLKSQAKEIQETKFKDKVVQVEETYSNYRPKQYSAKAWARMSDNQRANALRPYQNRNWDNYVRRGVLVVDSTGTRMVEKVIPFTLEDTGDDDYSYKDVYEGLSPDLKQFFDTPEVVLEKKATRIKTTKETIAQKQLETDKKIAEVKAKYEAKIRKSEESFDKRSSSYKDKYRDRQKEKIRGYEDDLDEKIEELRGYKVGLSKGLQQLDQNKDVDFGSIDNYAWDVANYYERKEEARNKARSGYREAVAKGELDEAFKKLGLNKDVGYYKFKKSVGEFNKKVEIQKNLIAKGERIGFDKLTKAEQIKVNPDLAQWQWENKGEKVLFKGLTPIGVESNALQQSLSFDAYQKVTDPEYIKAEWRKKNPPAPAPVRFDVESGGLQSYDPDQVAKNIFKSDPDAISLGGRFVSGKELPVGYGSQGTIQFDSMGEPVAPSVFMTTEQLNKAKLNEIAGLGGDLKDVWGGVKAGYGWANERVHFGYNEKTGGLVKFGKMEIAEPKYQAGVKTSFDFKEYAKAGGSDQTASFNDIVSGNVAGVSQQSVLVDTRSYEERTGKTRYEGGIDWLKDKTSAGKQNIINWVVGKENIEDFEKNLETKYQGVYQKGFEQKYFEKLVDGEIDFETASKEFSEGKEAKAIKSQYADEYTTGYEDLQKMDRWEFFAGKGVIGGVGMVGLGLADLGTTAIRTPLNVGVTAGAVYTGTGVLKAIPSVAMTGISGGLLVYGGLKALDPTLTFSERGAGFTTAVISGISLGASGYKYLKQAQKVKTVKIKAPKIELKSASSVGKDVKWKMAGKSGNTVQYKLSQQAQASTEGYRTIWTSKGRSIFNKYIAPLNKQIKIEKIGSGWGAKVRISAGKSTTYAKDLYQGVPTAELGRVTTISGLRGSYVIREPSAYQKMYQRMLKYNKYSPAQARASLRYTAPRIYNTYTEGIVNLNLKTGTARGQMVQTVKHPVIEIDKSLGIKTRGGADLKDITRVSRKLMQDPATKNIFSQEYGVRVQGFADKTGKLKDWKELELFGRRTRAVGLDQKGYEYLGKIEGIDVYRPDASLKNIFARSQKDVVNLRLTKSRFGIKGFAEANFNRPIEVQNVQLFNKVVDLDKANTWVAPANIKKTPFSKTFAPDKSSDIVRKIADKMDDIGSGTGSSNMNNLVNDIIKKTNAGGGSVTQSKYYGTGQYEQQFATGGLTQQQIVQNQNLLKLDVIGEKLSFASPVRSAILSKQLQFGTTLTVSNVLGLSTLKAVKTDMAFKTDLKTDNLLKDMVKMDTAVKTATAVKTTPALKSQLKSLLDVGLTTPALRTPAFKTPAVPSFKSPVPKPFVLPYWDTLGRKVKSKAKTKTIKELAYLPDFTSRSLGLTEDVKAKDLMKKIKKVQTGLEIRKGVKIKW